MPDQIQFENIINKLDDFARKIREKECTFENTDDELFLRELGTVTFYLSRLYHFERGSASIVQSIVRALVKSYTNNRIDLGDVRLGNNSEKSKNIPYDIYAQLVNNPNDYAKAFRNALIAEFKFARRNETKPSPRAEVSPTKTSTSPQIKALLRERYSGNEKVNDKADESNANEEKGKSDLGRP